MKKGDGTPPHDFVSQYDFPSALLEDLPWELHLLTVAGDEYFEYGEFVGKQHPGWNYLEFNFPHRDPRHYERVDRTTCRLADGIFNGDLDVSNGTVFARRDEFPCGFKICEIGFKDVNRDGFMDAVLLLGQQGGGSARVSGVYVLTRTQSGGRFYRVYTQADQKIQMRKLWENRFIRRDRPGGS